MLFLSMCMCVLRVQEEQTTDIPLKRIHQAKCLYFTIIQQTTAFLQVMSCLNGVCLILKVLSFIAIGSRFVYYLEDIARVVILYEIYQTILLQFIIMTFQKSFSSPLKT